jgi:hypothetical protein
MFYKQKIHLVWILTHEQHPINGIDTDPTTDIGKIIWCRKKCQICSYASYIYWYVVSVEDFFS